MIRTCHIDTEISLLFQYVPQWTVSVFNKKRPSLHGSRSPRAIDPHSLSMPDVLSSKWPQQLDLMNASLWNHQRIKSQPKRLVGCRDTANWKIRKTGEGRSSKVHYSPRPSCGKLPITIRKQHKLFDSKHCSVSDVMGWGEDKVTTTVISLTLNTESWTLWDVFLTHEKIVS